MWLVSQLNRKILLRDQYGGMTEHQLKWADGMVGCLPVFDTIEDVQEYCRVTGADVQIFELWTTGMPGVSRPYIKLVEKL